MVPLGLQLDRTSLNDYSRDLVTQDIYTVSEYETVENGQFGKVKLVR